MKKKQITFDTILNMLAFGTPIVILQIIILPIVGNQLGGIEYGNAITLISFSTLFSVPFGSVLNNIRLLNDTNYKEFGYEGDFNILLLINILFNVVIMILGGIYYANSLVSTLLIVIYSSLNIVREYLLVSFRLNLNYKLILENNFVLGIGYLLGLVLFFITNYWQYIYLMGNLLSLIFIMKHSSLWKEKLKSTPLFKETTINTLILLCSMLLNTAIGYADKLLLYPLIGPTAVTIYYSATILGKIVSMLISPLSNVVLSYAVKVNHMSKKKFIYMLTALILIGFIGYIIVMLGSYPVMKLLYPQWYEDSLKLIPITNLTAIIIAITSVINPIILRFKNVNWQLIVNAITLIIYLIGILVFYNQWGIIGFCLGVLFANFIKLIFTIVIFFLNK